MSTSFQAKTDGSEEKDDLIVHEGESEQTDERSGVGASVRDMAARIPEQLSAIGRDISRTIDRPISAKDDYMLAVKLSQDPQLRPCPLRQPRASRPPPQPPPFPPLHSL